MNTVAKGDKLALHVKNEALAMCLNCGRRKATCRNRYGERVCTECREE